MPAQLVINDKPPRLFKAFREPQFAKALSDEGRLRLWKLQYYTTIEDAARKDVDEGEGRLSVLGKVPVVTLDGMTGEIKNTYEVDGHFNYGTTWLNPTYIYCMAMPGADVTELRRRFGEHIVEIAEPERFLRALHVAILATDLGGRRPDFVDGFAVRYDKGAVGSVPEDNSVHLRLSYGQKRPEFACEWEYRVAVPISGPQKGSPEYLDLTLSNPGILRQI